MPKRTIMRVLRADTIAVEGLMAILSFGCGLFVALPFAAISPPFEQLGRVAPEWAWGAVLMGCGVLRFYVLKAPGRRLRMLAALICGPCWVALTAATALSNYFALAEVVYGIMSMVELWLLLRAPSDLPTSAVFRRVKGQ